MKRKLCKKKDPLQFAAGNHLGGMQHAQGKRVFRTQASTCFLRLSAGFCICLWSVWAQKLIYVGDSLTHQ